MYFFRKKVRQKSAFSKKARKNIKTLFSGFTKFRKNVLAIKALHPEGMT